MKKDLLGFVSDGEQRMRDAIEIQVRREYEEELSATCDATCDYWQRVGIQKEIDREVRERMKRVASPYSLWSSR